MLWRNDRRVLDAAEALVARLGTNPAHSVAAAAIDLGGRIHTAVNVAHFTGGPCAETALLGQVAAVTDDRIMTIVAVGDRGRGVIAPCGRCRQTLLDLHPDALVLVPTESDAPAGAAPAGADAPAETDLPAGAARTDAPTPEAVSVRSLLPHAYVSVDNGGPATPRVLRFAGRYREAVLAGRKTATVRFRDPHRVGPAEFVFEDPEREGFDHVPGTVDSVVRRRFVDLTHDDAVAEGLDDVAALREGLLGHYPDLRDDDPVDVLRITPRP